MRHFQNNMEDLGKDLIENVILNIDLEQQREGAMQYLGLKHLAGSQGKCKVLVEKGEIGLRNRVER